MGKWKRRPECAAHSSERKIQILQKKDQSEKKGRNAGSIHLFSLVFVFLQTVTKPPTWASMASLHRPTSGLHCRSKRKKEDGYFSSDSFLAAFYAYRQNHKATSDGAAVRKITKQTQTNKQTNKSHIWKEEKYKHCSQLVLMRAKEKTSEKRYTSIYFSLLLVAFDFPFFRL